MVVNEIAHAITPDNQGWYVVVGHVSGLYGVLNYRAQVVTLGLWSQQICIALKTHTPAWVGPF